MSDISADKRGISIVICTYNGAGRLGPTLQSIVSQQFETTLYELIIVDNASADNTNEFCTQFFTTSQVRLQWRIVTEYNPGLNHARLRGLKESKFDVVLFCDDDNILNHNYLKIAYELLESNPQIGALGGCGIPLFEGAKPDWFDTFSHSFAVGPQADEDGKLKEQPAELYGAGTFFRKAPLLQLFNNGFKAVMTDRIGKSLVSGGDVEWCYLIQLAGYELWYDQRLSFHHVMPEGRMQWSYYLRLKDGIASGAGKLFPYHCLLGNRSMNLFLYLKHWLVKVIVLILIYCKQSIRLICTPKPLSREAELGHVIVCSKTRSFIVDGGKALHHFKHLKKIM